MLFGSFTTTHISAHIQRITLMIKCVAHDDLGWKKLTTWYILPRYWLYEWFSLFHRCGTYSVLSRSPSVVNRWNMLDQDTVSAKSVNGFKSKLESERKRMMGLFLDWSLLGLVAVFHLWSGRNCELDQPNRSAV